MYLTKCAVLLSAHKKPVGYAQEDRPDNRGSRLRAGIITSSLCSDPKHGPLVRTKGNYMPTNRCGGLVVLLPVLMDTVVRYGKLLNSPNASGMLMALPRQHSPRSSSLARRSTPCQNYSDWRPGKAKALCEDTGFTIMVYIRVLFPSLRGFLAYSILLAAIHCQSSPTKTSMDHFDTLRSSSAN